MKLICVEKLTLTNEEVEILNNARILLDDIYVSAQKGGKIEELARDAMDEICDLLSDEYSDLE